MRRFLTLVIIAVIFGGVVAQFVGFRAPSQTAAPEAPAAPQPHADLAYALDSSRASWPPLAEEASSEATEPRAIVNYYVVLDGSGSMARSQCSGGQRKIDAAIAALNTFVQQIHDDQHMGLAVFDGRGLSERVPLAAHNRARMAEALAAVSVNGGTPLRSAIRLGFEQLTQQARRQLGYGEFHLVVVTDGAPDPANEDPTDVVNKILRDSPVLLHTIGFCIGRDHVLNQPGRVFYAAADSPEELRQGLGDVLAESPTFDVAGFGR